jgi:hypothetical protein
MPQTKENWQFIAILFYANGTLHMLMFVKWYFRMKMAFVIQMEEMKRGLIKMHYMAILFFPLVHNQQWKHPTSNSNFAFSIYHAMQTTFMEWGCHACYGKW